MVLGKPSRPLLNYNRKGLIFFFLFISCSYLAGTLSNTSLVICRVIIIMRKVTAFFLQLQR